MPRLSIGLMKHYQGTLWDGLPLRRQRAGADPDSPPRAVALPPEWEPEAAAALAALAPGRRPASLPRAAEAWIARALRGGQKSGLLDEVAAAHLAEGLRA